MKAIGDIFKGEQGYQVYQKLASPWKIKSKNISNLLFMECNYLSLTLSLRTSSVYSLSL